MLRAYPIALNAIRQPHCILHVVVGTHVVVIRKVQIVENIRYGLGSRANRHFPEMR